jgi:hypothetical protein
MRLPRVPARLSRLFLAFCFFSSPLLSARAQPAAGHPRIRYIFIIHKDIFDTSLPEENAWPYRMANKLHISTKDEIILREMFIQEGDFYDPFLADESERAIRKILRLRQVRIDTIRVDDHTVDLAVEVHETWTTEPFLSLSGVGDDLSGKVGLRERNVLGLGKAASFSYEKETGIINRAFSYSDPNVWGSRLRLGVNYDDSEDGLARELVFGRPFYSSITRWSAVTEGKAVDSETRLYDNGREVQRLDQRLRDFSLDYGRSIRSTPRLIRRAGVGYRYLADRLSVDAPSPAVFSDRRYHILQTGFHWERVKFLTADHVKLYDREEDFALGPAALVKTGFSRNWPGDSRAATFLEVETYRGLRFGPSHFALSTLRGDGRFEDGRLRNTRPRLDMEYYNHFSPRQTFAFHVQGECIVEPEADAQILLGGDRGLRGYQLNQFAGNKLLLANVENRFFLVDDMLRVMGLGSVVFVDAGYVWDPGESVALDDVKANIGTGLRFHISRSSLGHVLRLDVAYALVPVRGESRVVVTFGSSQAF